MARSQKILLFFLIIAVIALVGVILLVLLVDSSYRNLLERIHVKYISLIYFESTLLIVAANVYWRIFPDSPVMNIQKTIRMCRLFLWMVILGSVEFSIKQIAFQGWVNLDLLLYDMTIVSVVTIVVLSVLLDRNTDRFNELSRPGNVAWASVRPVK